MIEGEYNEEKLPFVHGSTAVREVRFYWDRPGKDPHNNKALKKLSGFAMSHGRQYAPMAGPYLDVIFQGDLDDRFQKRFESLQRTWRGTNGKRTTKPGDELTKAKRDNRAAGVCVQPCHSTMLLTFPVIRN